ncbi:MAG: zinc ABC transporter substrate-binding protein [Magnetococcales bacterium]|nr:zinc ABC transporter substrate-binding protein [Magnetococcales bacterium]
MLLWPVITGVEAAPKVETSIRPLHALVSGVMAGVGEPGVLVRGAASLHTYSLRPSEARRIAEAEVIFWVGEELELFLRKPLRHAVRARVVALGEVEGLNRLTYRQGQEWEEGEAAEEHDGEGDDHHHHHDGYDGHIWLDPENGKILVATMGKILSEIDPENAARYGENVTRMHARLDALREELQARLAPVRERPFVVFHDAYHYFEKRFGLKAVGRVALDPERKPGAKHLKALRERLEGAGAVCLFAEPQFEPRMVETLIRGTRVAKGILDPEGVTEQAEGEEGYFRLMRNLASGLVECLERK